MSMKAYLSLILLLFTSSLFAQNNAEDIDVAFGPMFNAGKRAVPTQFVGADDSGFYVIYSRGKHGQGEKIIYKFGYDLKPQLNKPLSKRIGALNTQTQSVFQIDEKLYHVSTLSQGREKRFYLQEIGTDNLNQTQPKELDRFQTEGKSAAFGTTEISMTEDTSRISIVYSIPSRRKENEAFGVNVFDREMNPLWKGTFELPYENRLLELQNYRIDNEGTVYMLGKRYFNKRRERVEGLVNYDYLLFSLQRNGDLDSLKIGSEGKFLRSMQVSLAANGDIISTGFYSDRNTANIGGAYYLRIDGQSREVINSSFKEFEIDFLTANMTERKAKRTKKRIEEGKNVELPSYYIDDLITKPDGGVIMIGEKRQIIVSTSYAGYVAVTTTSYYYDDILVVEISPEGEINWANRVAKKQWTVNDGAAYSSYATMVRDQEVVLIYNDNNENLFYDGVGRVAPMRKNSSTVVMAARVGEFGDVKRAGLFRRGEAEIKIRPVFAHQLDEDEMLIFGHRTLKNQRFVILKFK